MPPPVAAGLYLPRLLSFVDTIGPDPFPLWSFPALSGPPWIEDLWVITDQSAAGLTVMYPYWEVLVPTPGVRPRGPIGMFDQAERAAINPTLERNVTHLRLQRFAPLYKHRLQIEWVADAANPHPVCALALFYVGAGNPDYFRRSLYAGPSLQLGV